MKFTVITVVRNSETTILDTIHSVNQQSIRNEIEHIFVDGSSVDNTLKIIGENKASWDKVYSLEPEGIYHAMNFALGKCSGDYVCFLNADDYYVSNTVFEELSEYTDSINKFVFSSVRYIQSDKTKRLWLVENHTDTDLSQLPHPGVCASVDFIHSNRLYFREKYTIAADYDQQIRAKRCDGFKAIYRKNIIVNMRIGGKSNQSVWAIVKGIIETFEILRTEICLLSAISVTLRKLKVSLFQRYKWSSK